MTRPPRWQCDFCSAKRVTRKGIESHALHAHRAEYRKAEQDFHHRLFHPIEGDA